MNLKPELLELLNCPVCQADLIKRSVKPPAEIASLVHSEELYCASCGLSVPIQEGIPLFTSPPSGVVPSPKLERGPHLGTPWRQANWRFLEQQIRRLKPDACLLDVGAGRGDFADLTAQRRGLALDIYPYPEVDLVCDLTKANPLRPASFDAIVLMNVLEHIYDPHRLFERLVSILKPGGVLIVAVPFMVKLHQTPVDFMRYSQYALERLGQEHGLQVERMEGYYDPIFFLGEGIGNLKYGVLPKSQGYKRYLGRLLLQGIQELAYLLGRVVGPGGVEEIALPTGDQTAKNLVPTGYQVVYRK